MTWEQLSVVSDHANGSRVIAANHPFLPALIRAKRLSRLPDAHLVRNATCPFLWVAFEGRLPSNPVQFLPGGFVRAGNPIFQTVYYP